MEGNIYQKSQVRFGSVGIGLEGKVLEGGEVRLSSKKALED